MDYKKQALYNTAGNLIYMACLWVLSVLTVRLSGFEDAGVFSIAMSVGNIFYFIAMYGMRSFQASDAIRQFSGRVYIITRVVTVGIGILLCVVYLFFCDYEGYTVTAILLYLIFKCLEAGSDVLFGELQKVGHLEVCGISMSAKGIVSVIVFCAVMYFTKNLNYALAGITIVALITLFLYDTPSYTKFCKEDKNAPSQSVKALLLIGFPMLLTTVFPIMVTAIPRLQLENQLGNEMLGIYSSISTPTVLLTTIIPNMLCPFMTYYGECYQKGENKKLYKMLWLSILYSALLGLAACICAFFLGDFVLGLLFGKDVLPYMYIFIPLIIATTVYAFSMCGNSVLITIRHPFWLTSFAAAALVVCLVISEPLVKAYGMMGAVYAFGIPYGVQFMLQLIYMTYILLKKNKGEQ